MANVERPPSAASPAAAAPMSTPDSTPATGKAALDTAPTDSSPADSEKTVIAAGCSARASPLLRRMTAQPGTGAAVFSTDGGRHPRRNPPFPPPPVIVRSDKIQGVFEFAGYWRKKCPEFYHCFFPQAGWTITDLWDDADIHLESPGFLEDVLGVICHDNLVSVTKFAQAWGPLNPEKLEKLAKYTDLMYHANDPFAIVDEIFTKGEQDDCPRHFLYHATWALRQGMQTYMMKRHAAQSVSSVGPASKAESLSPTINDRTTNAELSSGPAVFVRPQSAFPGSSFSVPGSVQSAANGSLMRQPSFPPSQIQGPLPHAGDVLFITHPAPMIAGPFPGPSRHTKRRDRSGTNPYTQTSHIPGFVENGRPSGEQPRHLSGASLNGGTVHRYGPPMLGPFNPFPPGARLPSNTSLISPPMHPNQVEHMQMMPRVAIFPPPGLLPPQPLDPAYQQYAPTPFVDVSNNLQCPQGRNTDAHVIQRSNSQSAKTSGLFNPYGAERPDKAGFTSTGPRKVSRGNYSNNAGRGRKSSAGTFDRSLYGSYPSEPPGNGMRGGSGQFCEGPQVRQVSNTHELDPNIVNDKQFGCSYDFIGPQNDTVRLLYVKNLPEDVESSQLRAAVLECTGIGPATIQIKRSFDPKDFVQAFVGFDTVDEARTALEAVNAKNLKFRDRELQVSVARRYFQYPMSSQQPRGASHEFRRPVESNVAPRKSIQYSPQDARSDLHRVNKPQQPDHPAARGSPEARKAKKNLPTKDHTACMDPQSEIAEFVDSSSNSTSNVETGDSTEHDEPSSQDRKTDMSASTVVTVPIEKVPEKGPVNVFEETPTNGVETAPVNAVDEASINATIVDTITEEHAAAASELQQGPPQDSAQAVPDRISQLMTTERQGSLLSSPTKVASPLPADQMENPNEEPNVVSSPAEDSQVQDIAATSSAQDETPSDDDLKNDLSFHSAQESQPDGDDDDTQKGPGASATNIETELSSQAAPNEAHEAAGLQSCKSFNEPELDATMLQGSPCKKYIPTTSELYQTLTETAKKHGIKQIESLNPYSKTFRALQKKGKQAKKKEQKKKIKTESHADNTSAEAKGGATNANGTKKGPAQEQSDESSGKQSRRMSHVAPKQNLEAQHPMEVQESEGALEPAGSPQTVQSHEKEDVQASGANATFPSIELATQQEAANQGQEMGKKPKKIPSKIAVPNLDVLPPTSEATPPHTAYFSVTSPTPEKADVVREDDEVPREHEMVKAEMAAPHDSASIASSTTLRGSPPLMSLSPTANEFHTPLQTPTALGTMLGEAAKKNKKKKKSKKKSGNGSSTEPLQQEPFHDQLSHIENTKTGYYSLRNDQLPAREVLERRDDKGARGIILKVQAYVKEKAASYARDGVKRVEQGQAEGGGKDDG
ncbi:hypothetical protein PMIN02_003652 [Paraphaeosphaeria minitans]